MKHILRKVKKEVKQKNILKKLYSKYRKRTILNSI